MVIRLRSQPEYTNEDDAFIRLLLAVESNVIGLVRFY